jgi:metal-responsive CopG/Arc/MetJ family transcriptional regulator
MGRLRSVNFRLEEELLAKVDEIARARNTSRGAVIRMAVEHYIHYYIEQQQQETGLLGRVRRIWESLKLIIQGKAYE